MKLASIAAGLAFSSVAFVALLGAEPTTRMSVSQSQSIKREFVRQYPGLTMQEVELDHCKPLCYGGKNDRSNLQLQRWPIAKHKDTWEKWLCWGKIDLKAFEVAWPCTPGKLNEREPLQ